jgi:Flp pilus assembly protein TadG
MKSKGQTTVEFAMAAVLLLLFLFAVIDLSFMFYVNLTMQRAVREGARYAVTGQTHGKEGLDNMITCIKDASNGLYEQNYLKDEVPKVSVLTLADTKNFSNYTGRPITDSIGNPTQIIIVSLKYAWPLMTPLISPFFTDGRYTFTVRATTRHEPWGP